MGGFGRVSLKAHRSAAWGDNAHRTPPFLPAEFTVRFSEGPACAHTGVWNEGGLTDGGGHVVSGQYHHGPASPNVIWVLNCIFVSGLDSERERNRGEKRQMVFV